MRAALYVLIILLSLTYTLAATKTAEPLPDTLVGIIKCGCLLEEKVQPLGNTLWHTVVYVDFPDNVRWSKLYSMREDRMGAFKDCDKWMKYLQKIRKQQYAAK